MEEIDAIRAAFETLARYRYSIDRHTICADRNPDAGSWSVEFFPNDPQALGGGMRVNLSPSGEVTGVYQGQ